MFKRRRYEFCEEAGAIYDNELDMLIVSIEDVIERLNTQNENKNRLFKHYQLLQDEIRRKDQQLKELRGEKQ